MNQLPDYRIFVAIVLLASSTSGCMFQLRGTNPAVSQLQNYSIRVITWNPELRFDFNAALRARGFHVVSGDADVVIRVVADSTGSNDQVYKLDRDLSVKTESFIYALKITARRGEEELFTRPQTVELAGNYRSKGSGELANVEVFRFRLNASRREAVDQMVERLVIRLGQ